MTSALAEKGELLRSDAATAGRQLGHDRAAIGGRKPRPARHLGQSPLTAEAESALAVDDADPHAGTLDGLGVHPPDMPVGRRRRKPGGARLCQFRLQYL